MQETNHSPQATWTIAGNIFLLLGLWGDLFYAIHLEWSINEQYQYGWLVPLIGLYLIYLRALDKPPPKPKNSHSKLTTNLFVPVAFIFLYLLKIAYGANPEWRLLYWLQGLSVYLTTLFILNHWGGRSWVKHFALAFGMFLFSIPWVTPLEQPLILGLMQRVATATVEIMNLCGIQAIQHGNLIELSSTVVGVEEACSGVRSLQFTFMAGFFLGELLRFSFFTRLGLITTGIALSLFFNLSRTLFLTMVAHSHGVEAMEAWHNSAGYFVGIATFLALLIIAFAVKKYASFPLKPSSPPQSTSVNWIKPWKVVFCFLGLIGSFITAEIWYYAHNPHSPERFLASIDWAKTHPNVEFTDIPNTMRATLRYSEGYKAMWKTNEQTYWHVFFFTWDEGMISSFAGVHKPEVCMPAAGFEMIASGKPFLWEKGGFHITLKAYEFQRQGVSAFVFFSVWDNSMSAPIPIATKATERLLHAWEGKRITGRRQILTMIQGASSLQEAQEQMVAFLDRALHVDQVNSLE